MKKQLLVKFNRLKNSVLLVKTVRIVGFLFIILILGLFSYYSFYFHKIYPGVYVAGINLSGKTMEESSVILGNTIKAPDKINLTKEGQTYKIDLTSVDLSFDFSKSVQAAYNLDRSKNLFSDLLLKVKTINRKINLPLAVNLNEGKLREQISNISTDLSIEATFPKIDYTKGKIEIEKGTPGVLLDEDVIVEKVLDSISTQDNTPIEIVTKTVDTTLTQEEANKAFQRASNLIDKKLIIKFEYEEFYYDKSGLFRLLDPKGGYRDNEINNLIGNLSKTVERNPQNPVFVFESGVVKEFAPAREGIQIKKEQLLFDIRSSLIKLEESTDKTVFLNIAVNTTSPEYKTEEVNNLGIKELIGHGVSRFTGSIPSRIYNIGFATTKFNGVLVKPGETLSFNSTVGDISALTGFQQAYIIKDGKTILGDGGGVCQVSTTLFRAALNAGLPILERRSHAYRVSYYEQGSPPGIDATVYYPTTDLKIKNDTPNHILIQTKTDKKSLTLTFDIYGTNDGRTATVSKPIVSNPIPPPEDLYTDDPTLPTGIVKQVDWKAWGAKVSFKYKVVRAGETLTDKTYVSVYQPWQAKYLRGVGPTQ